MHVVELLFQIVGVNPGFLIKNVADQVSLSMGEAGRPFVLLSFILIFKIVTYVVLDLVLNKLFGLLHLAVEVVVKIFNLVFATFGCCLLHHFSNEICLRGDLYVGHHTGNMLDIRSFYSYFRWGCLHVLNVYSRSLYSIPL